MDSAFGDRLKNYRRAKNLTQQDLADLLGVSNKTVSRWESGGGWPDPPLLVPLARALGVTVDDLLDGEKPIRALTRTDWQSLLSFAFALGGGLLYFLLDLFTPAALCYLVYLGCMAYGVYLQRYYAYRSRWFLLGNTVMNFSVNLALAVKLLGSLASLYLMGAAGLEQTALVLLNRQDWLWRILGAGLLLSILATALTLSQVERLGFRGGEPSLPTLPALRLTRPKPREIVPALCALALGGFWFLYRIPGLPQAWYERQPVLYVCLALVLVLVCVLLSLGKRHRFGLVSAALLGLGGCILPQLTETWALLRTGEILLDTGLSTRYPRFGMPTDLLAVATLVLALLCLLPGVVKRTAKPAVE